MHLLLLFSGSLHAVLAALFRAFTSIVTVTVLFFKNSAITSDFTDALRLC